MSPKSRNRKRNRLSQIYKVILPCFAALLVMMVIAAVVVQHWSESAVSPYKIANVPADSYAPVSIDHEELSQLLSACKEYHSDISLTAALCLVRGIDWKDSAEIAEKVGTYNTEEEAVAALCTEQERQDVEKQSQRYGWIETIATGKILPVSAERIDYADSWGDPRSEGGDRTHEGTDIFAAPSQSPVVSVCNGVVEKKGWLYLGGWRIGVRGEDGIYYYYAHMSSYADVEEGDYVTQGTVLGYVGNSGYGEEGTTGKFAEHLHFGMYQGREKTEEAFDPYPYLNYWKDNSSK